MFNQIVRPTTLTWYERWLFSFGYEVFKFDCFIKGVYSRWMNRDERPWLAERHTCMFFFMSKVHIIFLPPRLLKVTTVFDIHIYNEHRLQDARASGKLFPETQIFEGKNFKFQSAICHWLKATNRHNRLHVLQTYSHERIRICWYWANRRFN